MSSKLCLAVDYFYKIGKFLISYDNVIIAGKQPAAGEPTEEVVLAMHLPSFHSRCRVNHLSDKCILFLKQKQNNKQKELIQEKDQMAGAVVVSRPLWTPGLDFHCLEWSCCCYTAYLPRDTCE